MRVRLRYLAVPAFVAAAVAANLPEGCEGGEALRLVTSCAMLVEHHGATFEPLELDRKVPRRLLGAELEATEPECSGPRIVDECGEGGSEVVAPERATQVRAVRGLPTTGVMWWSDYPAPDRQALLLRFGAEGWVMSEPVRLFVNRYLEHPIPRQAVQRPG